VPETKFPRHLGFQDFLEEATGQLFYQSTLTQHFFLGQPAEV
jgi:hypothetical protein